MSGDATDRFRDAMMAAARHEQAASDFPWPKKFKGIHQARRRECDRGLYASVGIAMGDSEASARQALENLRFFGAPHIAVITMDASLDVYGAVDCGYVFNFMLAATSFGVATVAQASLASRSNTVRQFLHLPKSEKILCAWATD